MGAANAEEAVLHGGVPATCGGADAGLSQRVGFGQGTGCAAAIAVSVTDAVGRPGCTHRAALSGS